MRLKIVNARHDSRHLKLINQGVVVTDPNTVAREDVLPPLPVEVEIDENAMRAQPHRDRG